MKILKYEKPSSGKTIISTGTTTQVIDKKVDTVDVLALFTKYYYI
jgi:hypothetical protein